MASKTIVFITGGNTGLGLEAIRQLCKSSKAYEIILGSRKVENGDNAVKSLKEEIPDTSSSLSVVQADVSSDESIEKAFETISSKWGKVDVLINNAGAGFDRHIYDKSMTMRQAWNASWDTNVAGTTVLTHTFVPLLLKSKDPRLLFITSGTSPLSETENVTGPIASRLNGPLPAGWPKEQPNMVMSYRSAKTGLNMMMREWHKTLTNDGVKVFAVSPGFLATGLGGMGPELAKKMGAQDPVLGGVFIRDVVEGKRDQDVGKAIRSDSVQPW